MIDAEVGALNANRSGFTTMFHPKVNGDAANCLGKERERPVIAGDLGNPC
jgi:hypothetical protein